MKEIFNYQANKGYFHSGDAVTAPDGCIIYPSANIIYDKRAVPSSVKNSTVVGNDSGEGGSRASLLDDALIAFMGNNTTTEKAVGNIFLGSNKDLWFVGNAISNAVRVSSNFSTFMSIGGVRQVETVTVTAGASAGGNLTVRVTGANITGSPVDVTVAVLNADTTAQVASKIVDALRNNSAILAEYFITLSSSNVILTDRELRANDGTLDITLQAAGGTGVTFGASTNTTAGSLDTQANLSSTPQMARWNGSFWDNPVQIGLAPQDDAPTLELTDSTTIGASFNGRLTGSMSARLARKRNGAVSIASGMSNVVTADGNSAYVTIPAYTEDGSNPEDRIWLLYFTYAGRGSQFSHFLFPIEIPERYLNGTEANGWTETVGANCRVTVVTQHASTQASRKIEIEYNDSDLLLINPFEDYFPLDACKFVTQLGNVVCGIGTGTDQTGFDVSFPNNREAFPPDWREWFREVPVSLSMNVDTDYFWVACSYCTYQAIWTGATQGTAPVVLKEVSNRYGAIGEGATIGINGTLYMLSKGKIPVRIDGNGAIDATYAENVIDYFTDFDSSTQLGYDEKTNTVYFFNNSTNKFIGFQIDTGIWTAPINLETLDIDACFTMDGFLHYCIYIAGSSTYKTYKFNSNTGVNTSWVLATNYKTGQLTFNLKDVIEVRALIESQVADTITITGVRDFDDADTDQLIQETTSASSRITYRKYVESLDYEAVAVKASGSKYGQTVHNIALTVDNHNIERTKN